MSAVRPAQVCSALLLALDAAEGRRRARKRDQTPDAYGLALKRALLERVIRDDPERSAFEACLLRHVVDIEGTPYSGGAWAMARVVLDEWRLAHDLQPFARWLSEGAPSADAGAEGRSGAGVCADPEPPTAET